MVNKFPYVFHCPFDDTTLDVKTIGSEYRLVAICYCIFGYFDYEKVWEEKFIKLCFLSKEESNKTWSAGPVFIFIPSSNMRTRSQTSKIISRSCEAMTLVLSMLFNNSIMLFVHIFCKIFNLLIYLSHRIICNQLFKSILKILFS